MALFKNRRISLERLEKYHSDSYWTDVNFRSKVFPQQRQIQNLRVYHVPSPDHRPLVGEILKIDDSLFMSAAVGDSFGPSWSTHWFKFDVVIPAEWHGKRVVLVWDSNSEAMLYEDEKCLQAFTGGTGSDRRALYILQDENADDSCTARRFMVEMACNGMFGNGMGGMIQPDGDRSFTLATAEIALMDNDAWDLLWDFIVLSDIAHNLPAEAPRAAQAMAMANDMVNIFDRDDRKSWQTARQVARSFLDIPNAEQQHEVTAIGHCHIDTAWLWPYAETRRKIARSWATQLELQRRTPYTFAVSQAVQLKWLKEDHPTLFQDVKQAVAEGRFVPVGGTFVEMDANMPSGESFARQFLYGQRFFHQEFGRYCDEFWLPDTFGYSAQLPQLMKLAGIKYFLSQKISWNLVTKFPHTSFVWKGIDGSSVLAHFPPADTYTSAANVTDLLKSCTNCQDKAWSNRSMLLYGHGDGGGGPSMEHLEQLTRLQNVTPLPTVRMQSCPQTFFEKVAHDFKQARRCPPTWQGELYLELHQGTLTSQALVKQRNRECERALHDLEWLLAFSRCVGGNECETLRRFLSDQNIQGLWEDVLLNQFHDVLPGSCIGMVYEDVHKLYDRVLAEAAEQKTCCMSYLCMHGFVNPVKVTDNNLNSKLDETLKNLCAAIYSVNATSIRRSAEVLNIPRSWVEAVAPELIDGGACRSYQWTVDGEILLLPVCESIAGGIAVHPVTVGATALERDGDGIILENEFLRAEITRFGTVTSLLDKRCGGRETVGVAAEANTLMLYENVPFYWDAWDVMPYHLEKGAPLHTFAECSQITITEHGPIRAACMVKLTYARGTVAMCISLDSASPTLDFSLDIDWQENRKLLKVEFPLDIVSDAATYEIQFGAIRRPNHGNTEADAAKYEVCAQRFADLSEGGYGVALLNNSKYGYSCRGSTLCMSLLRGPKAPDTECDLGYHRINYALFPHVGDSLVACGTVERAICFNHPLLTHFEPTQATLPTLLSPFTIEHGTPRTCLVILDTAKLAEGNGGAVVIRMYEAAGGRGHVTLRLPVKIRQFGVCDILERPLPDSTSVERNEAAQELDLSFKPFEVKTVLVTI